MNILIAPDKFKDSLSGKEVGEAIRKGISSISDDFSFRIVPMADGGEGTVLAMVEATEGVLVNVAVHDPLMRVIDVQFGILGGGKTAVIEMASASGIELLAPHERNPMITSTFGTGELIKHALDKGCERIIIGIGGSATNDAGTGMAQALGVHFMGDSGKLPIQGGGQIGQIRSIDLTALDSRIKSTEFIIACDVNNPLTGPQGASYIYGPQKGADKTMVKNLDKNLKHFSELIQDEMDIQVDLLPGAGAAGGLGAGLVAFAGAQLNPGFSIVSMEVELEKHLQWADLVITGEGKIDHQTQYGKTPLGVTKLAKQNNLPVLAIAGTLGEGYKDLYKLGFDGIFSIIDRPMKLEEALISAPDLIARCAESMLRTFMLGKI